MGVNIFNSTYKLSEYRIVLVQKDMKVLKFGLFLINCWKVRIIIIIPTQHNSCDNEWGDCVGLLVCAAPANQLLHHPVAPAPLLPLLYKLDRMTPSPAPIIH